MTSEVGTPFPIQVAVLGSSGDLASDEHLVLAAAVGFELASRRIVCVTGGGDGVMGAAARAAKARGGTTIAVTARDKALAEGSMFDAHIDTGLSWVQFSDAILRSCTGAIVIGGGAGTLGELAIFYLAQRPVVFCGTGALADQFGDRPLDERGLTAFPVVDDPAEAVDRIVGGPKGRQMSETATQAGARLHFSSYPFGAEARYADAAANYRVAASTAGPYGPANAHAFAAFEDALGDIDYYDRQAFLSAATHFELALRHATLAGELAFAAYLKAIMLESIASGLHEAGLSDLAAAIAQASADRYEAAIGVSPADEHKYLRHSADGLRGDAALFEAHALFENGRPTAARDALARARLAYETALGHHPTYGENVSSSNFGRVIQQVEDLEVLVNDQLAKANSVERDG